MSNSQKIVNYQAINFAQKLSLFSEQWQPKVIAQINNHQVKIVKIEGDFQWHQHKDSDESFFVLEGCLRLDFRDGSVQVNAGEMYVVPKGVEHKPYAASEVKMLLIVPDGVINTGDGEANERTAQGDVWI
ncbi:MAG: cupin domain-containing protein [Oceanospirillaceae bacterium]|nr:cupin domain-containing protein [Oceanospirillaceae bacterium]